MPGILPADLTSIAPVATAAAPITNGRAEGSAKPEAFRQLEAFVLQSFIETMLPENAEAVFGKGTAGAIWKSMLAEKLAKEIADSGAVGIAEQLAKVSDASTAVSDRPGTSVSKPTQAGISLLSIPQQLGEDA